MALLLWKLNNVFLNVHNCNGYRISASLAINSIILAVEKLHASRGGFLKGGNPSAVVKPWQKPCRSRIRFGALLTLKDLADVETSEVVRGAKWCGNGFECVYGFGFDQWFSAPLTWLAGRGSGRPGRGSADPWKIWSRGRKNAYGAYVGQVSK